MFGFVLFGQFGRLPQYPNIDADPSKSERFMTYYFSRKETIESPNNSLILSPSHEVNSSD